MLRLVLALALLTVPLLGAPIVVGNLPSADLADGPISWEFSVWNFFYHMDTLPNRLFVGLTGPDGQSGTVYGALDATERLEFAMSWTPGQSCSGTLQICFDTAHAKATVLVPDGFWLPGAEQQYATAATLWLWGDGVLQTPVNLPRVASAIGLSAARGMQQVGVARDGGAPILQHREEPEAVSAASMSETPEPGTWVLVLAGAALMAVQKMRRR